MTLIIIQIFIALTAPTAIYLLGHDHRKWACIIGLGSQIGFVLLYVLSIQYIMLIPTCIYTLVWINNWKGKK